MLKEDNTVVIYQNSTHAPCDEAISDITYIIYDSLPQHDV